MSDIKEKKLSEEQIGKVTGGADLSLGVRCTVEWYSEHYGHYGCSNVSGVFYADYYGTYEGIVSGK